MKRILILSVMLVFSYIIFGAYTPGEAHVRKAPPARKVVVVKTPKPYHNAVWVEGHWNWHAKKAAYVWTDGHWQKPKKGMVWVQGKWVKKRHDWVWIPGHWKKR